MSDIGKWNNSHLAIDIPLDDLDFDYIDILEDEVYFYEIVMIR